MYGFLKSKIRKKILEYFFYHVDERFYLRQMEKLLGFSAGNIRRELLKLKKEDLLKTEKVGNLVFYFLNQEYVLLDEVKNIVLKKSDVRIQLKKIFAEEKDITTAFIYGSHAAGIDMGSSDIDIFIIGNPDLRRIMKKIRIMEKELGREINLSCYTAAELESMKKNKDGFLESVLGSGKINLIGENNVI